MTHEKNDANPGLQEILDALEFDFFWDFAGAWTKFRNEPSPDATRFLAEQRLLAQQHKISLDADPRVKANAGSHDVAPKPGAVARQPQPKDVVVRISYGNDDFSFILISGV